MGVFDRLVLPDEEPVVAGAPTTPRWSEAKQARWGRLFAGPIEALEDLQQVGERLRARRDQEKAGLPPKQVFGEEAVEDLQSYAVAAQALKPDRGEVDAAPRLYRRLGSVLLEHLETIPEVTAYRLTGGYLRAIGEDVRDAEAEDLASIGAALRKALKAAREARKAPALERREDLGPGTTASLAEQFRSQYRAGEPTEESLGPEEPLPPAKDLDAEAVFRLLLEECLGDGRISRAEARAISQLRELLGLSLRRHQAMLEEVMEEVTREGVDPTGEDLDPLAFFERCCRLAMADGVVEGGEKDLLQRVGQYLHITPEEYAGIRARMAIPEAGR